MNLELSAVRWLQFYKRCPIVIQERTPMFNVGRPDVLGVTKARFLIEIEVKRSLSDFRANRNKGHVANRHLNLHRWPKQFYFLVPQELSERVLPEIPEWAGLAIDKGCGFEVLKTSPTNKDAKKLSVRGCVELAHLMGNEIVSLREQLQSFRHNDEPWGIEYQI